MTGRGVRRTLSLLARLVVAVLVLAFVLRSVELGRVLEVLAQTKGQYVGLALGVFSLIILTAAFRLRILLTAQSIKVTYRYVCRLAIIAELFNNLLPSNIGGDVYRIYDVARVGKDGGAAAVVVLADRLSGLIGLLLFVLAAMVLGYGQFQREVLAVIGLACIGLAAMILAWIGRRFTHQALGKLSVEAARRLEKLLSQVEQAIWAYRGHLAALLAAIGVSLAVESLVVLVVFLMAQAVGIEVPVVHFFVLIPMSTLLLMVPASIGGVGIREGIYVYFFSRLGVAPEVALSLSMMMYLPKVLMGIAGALLLLLGRRGVEHDLMASGTISSDASLPSEKVRR